jgi:hypothetical protein
MGISWVIPSLGQSVSSPSTGEPEQAAEKRLESYFRPIIGIARRIKALASSFILIGIFSSI